MELSSMRIGTVPGEKRFHEVPVEIFQRVTRRLSEASCALSQFRSDEHKPNVTGHCHSWAQSRCGSSRVRSQKILHVLFDDGGKLLDGNGSHHNRNVRDRPDGREKTGKEKLQNTNPSASLSC